MKWKWIFALSLGAALGIAGTTTQASAYQNPKSYYQVQDKQIKPYGKVGYTVKRGYEGIKTWKIMKKMHTFGGYDKYNTATYYQVKNFQRKHHLKVTGNVDETTWVKMGFSKSSWTSIDSYVAPLTVTTKDSRKAHVEAMIKQAYKYKGNPYLVGSSSSPSYGVDCSGLAMQALYAGGINPAPISSINHAHPGNEWNSRNLWASKKLKRVAYKHRERGDLIFYYQPGTHVIWHVAIYLGGNKVIESWPPRVMVQPIRNGQRSDIAGVKRPFL
ncbi:MAG TPA: peptidase [Lactobacillus sp.]|nr:peptidase [Lactobacillus sp.]